MPPRIAIPMPHSIDREYAERAIPVYEDAVEQAGGEPLRIPLDQSLSEVMKFVEACDGVLLPGSNADVDPARFAANRSPHTAAADPRRGEVDDLLLQDAYKLRKPILGICYGLQSLNVYRRGSLIQHIPDFLPEELRTRVNHEAGRAIDVAHAVEIETDSRLARIMVRAGGEGGKAILSGARALASDKPVNAAVKIRHQVKSDGQESPTEDGGIFLLVNSSHHQSADRIGDGLSVSARSPDDGIIEALEGTDLDHFVLAVQWHPERSVGQDEASRAIFQALIEAAQARTR